MVQTIDSEFLRRRRGRFPIVAVLVVVAAIFLGGKTALSYYVDSLWFSSLGYGDVFFKTLRLESTIFLVFAAATFLILYGSFQALWHAAGNYLANGHTVYVGGQALTLPVDPVMRFVAIGGSLVVALISGSVMLSNWPTFALYWYAPAALSKVVDPIFHKPLEFYLFTLPVWQLFSGWLIVMAVIVSAVAAVFFAIGSGARTLAARRGKYIRVPSAALSISFALLLLVIAMRVYLGRFDYLLEDHTILAGVTYTDAHVLIPGLFLVSVALVIGAALIAASTFSTARVR